MKNKSIIIIAFIIVSLIQLAIPAQMIYNREMVLKSGKVLKLITTSVDPSDPLRGEYISLYYKENMVHVQNIKNWKKNEPIYVTFIKGKDDFAKVANIQKEKPTETNNYVVAKVGHILKGKGKYKNIIINYPFNAFYMEEFKAGAAENAQNEAFRDTTIKQYALIAIQNGEAVVKDVIINGIPVRDLAKMKKQIKSEKNINYYDNNK